MSRADIPDFPDVNVVAQILLDKKKFIARDISELKANPEFQVFRIIGQSKVLSTETIESKFESQSLSMILSNLQADDLIEQTSDYRWRVSEQTLNLLLSREDEIIQQNEEEEERMQHLEKMRERNSKKALYKKIADQLVESGYVPAQHTVEDLFSIPEVEILTIIYQNSPIGADKIDQLTNIDSSVSLALSNLSADGYIKQNENYQWELSQNLKNELANISISSPETSDSSDDPDMSMEYGSKQNQIIEHKQLLKAIIDINYFGDKKINQIIETPEFEILNIINSNSPIGSDEIEEKLTQETLLSLSISNLKADGLIEQTNDYRYVLSEEFRIRVSKVKVSRQEIMDQLRAEEEGEIKSKSTSDEKKSIPLADREVKRERSIKSQSQHGMIEEDPIAMELIKTGYITSTNITSQELTKIPEYEVLKLLSQEQPLSSDEIDERTHSSSVSLTLSNLAADNLIKQREEDFKYELTPELTKFATKKPSNQTEDTSTQEVANKPEKVIEQSKPISSNNFKPVSTADSDIEKLSIATEKVGYIDDVNAPLDELLQIPEFEVLKLIGDMEPVSEEVIKEQTKSVSPVLVSRTISRLEADERITRNPDGRWEYTEKFHNLLIEDELLAKERIAQLEADRQEQKRLAREKEERARREKFISLLKAEGIIEDEGDQDKLMQIPEFEVMWIISDAESGINEDEIKEKAKSTTPVMITRTLGQLETKGRIQKTLSGYELSSDLKNLS